MIEHVSLRCSDSRASRRFYEQALTPLGYKLSKKYGDAFGFRQGGRHDFWVTAGKVGTPGHVAFTAADHRGVEGFYSAALKAGGKDNGGPGVREGYGYAAFVFDPDGHNVEAVCFDELEKGGKLEDIAHRRIAAAKGPAKKASPRKVARAGSKRRAPRASAKVARARRPRAHRRAGRK